MDTMNEALLPTSVGIIGCGWLGKALAIEIGNQQCDVIATVRNQNKVTELASEGINAETLVLPFLVENEGESKTKSLVFQQKSLVICIPPQLKQGKSDYPEKLNQIVEQAEQGDVEQIVLVSTSSIYNGLSGEVGEASSLNFSAEKVAVLHQAEQAIKAFKGTTSILRLTGLIGPKRHPGRFLKSKRVLTNPNGVVNLIHQQDAIGLLISLLKQPELQGVFNGVSETHLTRQAFYHLAAQSINLPKAEFAESAESDPIAVSKLITDHHTRQTLAYQYVFDDLSKWLKLK
jgi:nucleoside-diphosphate-sugar epimerase